MKTKTVRNIVIAVAVIGLMGWRLASNKNEMEEKAERSFEINPTVLVRVDSVKYFNADNTIMVDGRINACNEVTLYSKIQGIVLKKYKKAGDRVGKGTVIAQVENAVIREMLGLAELNLANAAKDVERYKKLAESGAVTQREYESILITSREAQRAVVELKEQLANTTLTSPVNGILETDYFEEGTLLSPGTQVADFVDPSGLKAIVSITESEMYRVRKGDKTVLTTDILPNHTFDGIVDVISSKGNNRLSYQVEILITDRRADLLKSGMYVSTQIIPEQISGNKKMVINRKAIIESLQTPEVYVIKDNKAYKQKITIGKVADNFVEVTAGLSLNDKVVVSGQINLLDGRDIQIIK